jgi:hypothetical protein
MNLERIKDFFFSKKDEEVKSKNAWNEIVFEKYTNTEKISILFDCLYSAQRKVEHLEEKMETVCKGQLLVLTILLLSFLLTVFKVIFK